MAVDLELLVSEARGTALEQSALAVAEAAKAHDLCCVCLNPETVECAGCFKRLCPAHRKPLDDFQDVCAGCYEDELDGRAYERSL